MNFQNFALKAVAVEKPSDCAVEGNTSFDSMRGNRPARGYDGSGSAARFFYAAKASPTERNEGCEDLEAKTKPLMGEFKDNPGRNTPKSSLTARANHHPTVKAIKLMEFLCKLVVPPNGIVLDPFTGSGSTLVAAVNLGFRFIGIEQEQEYCAIASARVRFAQEKKSKEPPTEVNLPLFK